MKRLATLALITATVSAASAATPKILICSDSTTANYDPTTSVLQGWGYYLQDYLTIAVSNLAVNGRSTRSYINEGRWANLLTSTNAGDFVLIEMGHNDDVDPTNNDTAARGTLPGIGEETVVVTTSKGEETVHTFGWYLRKMIAEVEAKKAIPVISGMVPRNYWKGNTLQSDWAFADYAKEVAQAAGVTYVDHTKYSVAKLQSFGPTKAKTFFPNDNTHTNPAGAIINSDAFATAVKCGSNDALTPYLNAKGKSFPCT